MKLPQRPMQHNLEEASRRFFEQSLPENWTVNKPEHDYGVDLMVGIFDGEYASPYEIAVQLKSSEKANEGDFETIKLRVATFNHLKRLLPIVLLVKFVKESEEGYYLLLAKVPEPDQEQDTFTIQIPKQNRLSEINWQNIEATVRQIVDYKLASGDEVRNAMRQQGLL